jgi:hypothetical protein
MMFCNRAVGTWVWLAAAALVAAGWTARAGEAETATASAAPASAEKPNVVVIVWDGARRSTVQELLKAGKLPNLDALAKAGSLQDMEVKGHQTATLPSHGEMLTGLSQKALGNPTKRYSAPMPRGSTLFERIRGAPDGKSVATALVVGKFKLGELCSRAKDSIDVLSAPPSDQPQQNLWSADTTGPACIAAMEKLKGRRFLMFVNFADPDTVGHKSGSESAEYRAAFVTCDDWLGRMMDWLKQNKLDDSTLFYVTADHGFDLKSRFHSNAPEIWLATNDKKVIRGGSLADLAPTVLWRFGLDLAKVDPKLKLIGTPLTEKAPAEEPKALEPKPVPVPASVPAREPVLAPAGA